MFHLTRNQRDHTCRKRTCLLPVVAHVMLNFKIQAAVIKMKFLAVQNGFTQKGMHAVAIIGTTGAAAILEKRWRTERPSLPLYLNELPIENCHFRNPDSAFILKRVAQMAPWHHVGATMDITLDTTFIFVWQAAKPRTAKFNLYFTVVAIWYSLVSTACTYSFLESGWGYIWFLRKTFIVFTKYDHGIYFRSNCLGWFVRYRTQFLMKPRSFTSAQSVQMCHTHCGIYRFDRSEEK